MSYFRICDRWRDNEKVKELRRTLDPRTFRSIWYVWLEMGTHCSGNYTDGKIHFRDVCQVCGLTDKQATKLMAPFFRVGMLIGDPAGWIYMHDFLVYNISRVQHDKQMEGGRQRKREHDARRQQDRMRAAPAIGDRSEIIISDQPPTHEVASQIETNQPLMAAVTPLRTPLPDPVPYIAAQSASYVSEAPKEKENKTTSFASDLAACHPLTADIATNPREGGAPLQGTQPDERREAAYVLKECSSEPEESWEARGERMMAYARAREAVEGPPPEPRVPVVPRNTPAPEKPTAQAAPRPVGLFDAPADLDTVPTIAKLEDFIRCANWSRWQGARDKPRYDAIQPTVRELMSVEALVTQEVTDGKRTQRGNFGFACVCIEQQRLMAAKPKVVIPAELMATLDEIGSEMFSEYCHRSLVFEIHKKEKSITDLRNIAERCANWDQLAWKAKLSWRRSAGDTPPPHDRNRQAKQEVNLQPMRAIMQKAFGKTKEASHG